MGKKINWKLLILFFVFEIILFLLLLYVYTLMWYGEGWQFEHTVLLTLLIYNTAVPIIILSRKKLKNNKKILTIIISIIFIVILIDYFVVSLAVSPENNPTSPDLTFIKDVENKTLTVAIVYPDNVKWSDIEIRGNASYPISGIIKVGDTITNCTDVILIIYKPTNTILGERDFTEK